MRRIVDLTGKVFGKWKVIEKDLNSKSKETTWICQCECGTMRSIIASGLLRGQTTQCRTCSNRQKNAENVYKHGKTKTRLYSIWQHMKQRCCNPKTVRYENYGGRGITVCDLWKDDFEVFEEWALRNGYQENLTLDRIDNSLGYSPNNCRWATNKVQQNNKRNNIIVKYDGKTQTLAQWCELLGLNYSSTKYKINKGFSTEEAFTK